MSATRLRRLFRRDDAEVGVGTLIVFIAMVLVAAVAAAVIIGTSGSLQQRAQTTGKEATQEVASNLKVVGIDGIRNSTSVNVYTLRFTLEMQSGSTDIDLDEMLIRFSDGSTTRVYQYGGTYPFTLDWVRGDGADNVMEPGDLVELDLTMIDTTLAPRSDFEMLLMPQVGAEMYLAVKMPPTFGSDTIVGVM